MAENGDTNKNWHFSGSIMYSSRSLDGTIASKLQSERNYFGDLLVTGESMNVGTSNTVTIAAAAQYKRWGIGLNYIPTQFSGLGSAIVGVSNEAEVGFIETPLNTDINVNMLLLNGSYNFIQTGNRVFGVGAGLGRTVIDLNIIPEVGNSIIYDGTQPFGFLNVHFSDVYKRFIYSFALNGISGAFSGVGVDYSDYTFEVGYRVVNQRFKLDIVGGHRMVNFAVDIEQEPNITKADITLEGPYLGLKSSF